MPGQLAQSRYMKVERPGVEPTTSWSNARPLGRTNDLLVERMTSWSNQQPLGRVERMTSWSNPRPLGRTHDLLVDS